jgi:O-succinylhomoserine sulfhydrylase
VVDNVFATPLLQHPLKLGADCVVYSATKHIDGQGRVLGGVILASEKFIADHIHNFLRQTGPSLSPFNAWVLLKSLETLPCGSRAGALGGAKIAEFLSTHPAVVRVLYPGRADHPQAALARRQMSGGGTLLAFEVEGGKAAAFRRRQRAVDHRHLEQSRRRQEPHHPSGDDDAPAAEARTARGARHRPRAC